MKKKITKDQIPHDKIAKTIANIVLKIQCRWVNFMKSQTEKLSYRNQKIWFLISSVVFSFFCVQLIVGAFTNKPINERGFHQTKIFVPVLQGDNKHGKEENIDSLVRQNLKEFYQIRDSLQQYAPWDWERVIENKPGILDSMAQLERLIKKIK